MDLIFGSPRKLVVKVEMFPEQAVITLLAKRGKGTNSTIVFNNGAVEALQLKEEDAIVAISFKDGLYIANGDNEYIDEEDTIKVSKGKPRRFSHGKTYADIILTQGLDEAIDNHFKFEEFTGNNTKKVIVFTLIPIQEPVKGIDVNEPKLISADGNLNSPELENGGGSLVQLNLDNTLGTPTDKGIKAITGLDNVSMGSGSLAIDITAKDYLDALDNVNKDKLENSKNKLIEDVEEFKQILENEIDTNQVAIDKGKELLKETEGEDDTFDVNEVI